MANDLEHAPGLNYDPKNRKVFISDHSVDTIVAGTKDIILGGLQWAERNPFEFFALLAFLAFASLLAYLGRVQDKRMELEYRRERSTSKEENSLLQKAE